MPPMRMPTEGETPTTLNTPHHAIRATRVCVHSSAEIRTYDIRAPIRNLTTDGSASAASEIEVGSIYPTMPELRAAAVKQADNACVARVVWCGIWRVEGVSLYVGIRIGRIGWKHGGSLMG